MKVSRMDSSSKKQKQTWCSSSAVVDRNIPEYNAIHDEHCLEFVARRKKTKKTLKRAKTGRKRSRPSTNITFLNGPTKITTQLLDEDVKGIEIELIQLIMKREALLEEIFKTVETQENRAVLESQFKDVPKNLEMLVMFSVKVVEALCSWRKEIKEPRAFIYNDNNILLKLIRDVEKLQAFPKLLDRLRKYAGYKNSFSFKRNPLLSDCGLPSIDDFTPRRLMRETRFVFSRGDLNTRGESVSKEQLVLDSQRRYAAQQVILLEELLHQPEVDKVQETKVSIQKRYDRQIRPSSSGPFPVHSKPIDQSQSTLKDEIGPRPHTTTPGNRTNNNLRTTLEPLFQNAIKMNATSTKLKASTRLQAMDEDIRRSRSVIENLKERIVKLETRSDKPPKTLRRIQKKRGVGWKPLDERQSKNRHHLLADDSRNRAGIKQRSIAAKKQELESLKQELSLRKVELNRKEVAKYNFIQHKANLYAESIADKVREAYQESRERKISWDLIDVEMRLKAQEKPSLPLPTAATYIQKMWRGVLGRRKAVDRKAQWRLFVEKQHSYVISHDVICSAITSATTRCIERWCRNRLKEMNKKMKEEIETIEDEKNIELNRMKARTKNFIEQVEIDKKTQFNRMNEEKVAHMKDLEAKLQMEIARIEKEKTKEIHRVEKALNEKTELESKQFVKDITDEYQSRLQQGIQRGVQKAVAKSTIISASIVAKESVLKMLNKQTKEVQTCTASEIVPYSNETSISFNTTTNEVANIAKVSDEETPVFDIVSFVNQVAESAINLSLEKLVKIQSAMKVEAIEDYSATRTTVKDSSRKAQASRAYTDSNTEVPNLKFQNIVDERSTQVAEVIWTQEILRPTLQLVTLRITEELVKKVSHFVWITVLNEIFKKETAKNTELTVSNQKMIQPVESMETLSVDIKDEGVDESGAVAEPNPSISSDTVDVLNLATKLANTRNITPTSKTKDYMPENNSTLTTLDVDCTAKREGNDETSVIEEEAIDLNKGVLDFTEVQIRQGTYKASKTIQKKLIESYASFVWKCVVLSIAKTSEKEKKTTTEESKNNAAARPTSPLLPFAYLVSQQIINQSVASASSKILDKHIRLKAEHIVKGFILSVLLSISKASSTSAD